MTSDGWHQKGDMGWWGCDSNVNAGWDDQARAMLRENQDKFGVVVDCHI